MLHMAQDPEKRFCVQGNGSKSKSTTMDIEHDDSGHSGQWLRRTTMSATDPVGPEVRRLVIRTDQRRCPSACAPLDNRAMRLRRQSNAWRQEREIVHEQLRNTECVRIKVAGGMCIGTPALPHIREKSRKMIPCEKAHHIYDFSDAASS